MTFEEFCSIVKKEISEHFNGCEVTLQEVIKNNGNKLTAMHILDGTTCVRPIVYLESFYDKFRCHNYTLQDMVKNILEFYEDQKMDLKVNSINELITLDNIFFQVVNYDRNSYKVDNTPHRKFEDLLISYRALVSKDDKGIASILLTNEYLERLNVTEEELFDAALKNTPKLFPFRILNFFDIVRNIGVEPIEDPSIKALVVTNTSNVDGFSAMLYPEVIEYLRELEGYIYVLPSSIHEALVVQSEEEVNTSEIKHMVVSVNRDAVSLEDFLSNSVYTFDKESGCIHVVE